jgi:hypothetical protein
MQAGYPEIPTFVAHKCDNLTPLGAPRLTEVSGMPACARKCVAYAASGARVHGRLGGSIKIDALCVKGSCKRVMLAAPSVYLKEVHPYQAALPARQRRLLSPLPVQLL